MSPASSACSARRRSPYTSLTSHAPVPNSRVRRDGTGRIFQNHPPRRRRDARIARRLTRPLKTQVPQQKIDENGGLMEYSVVYTDRAMNHMSAPFQEVMNCVEIKFRTPHVVDET